MKTDISMRCEGGLRFTQPRQQSAPLVSVLVVVFRDKNELQQVVQSVLPYRSVNVELIVIDGGSMDGTLELLESFNDRIDYWLSEPDHGIYDAMNKALRAARGDYILHLNAGDRLLDVPLDALQQCLHDQIDIAACRVLIDDIQVFTPRTGFPMRIDNWWHHQGTFYRRQSHLGYNTTYRVFGDFDHNQRLMKANHSIRLLPQTVAAHRNDGLSMGNANRGEVFRSIRTNFGAAYLPIAYLRFQFNKLRAILKQAIATRSSHRRKPIT